MREFLRKFIAPPGSDRPALRFFQTGPTHLDQQQDQPFCLFPITSFSVAQPYNLRHDKELLQQVVCFFRFHNCKRVKIT